MLRKKSPPKSKHFFFVKFLYNLFEFVLSGSMVFPSIPLVKSLQKRRESLELHSNKFWFRSACRKPRSLGLGVFLPLRCLQSRGVCLFLSALPVSLFFLLLACFPSCAFNLCFGAARSPTRFTTHKDHTFPLKQKKKCGTGGPLSEQVCCAESR